MGAHLQIDLGDEGSRRFELDDGGASIGRGIANELAFQNPWLSRSHARISCRDGRYYVVDLGSRNGTYVNGVALRTEQALRHGDVISLGDIRLRFSHAAGALHVADSNISLTAQGTVVIGSEELDFDRYSRQQVADEGGLLPALNAAAAALISYYPLEELLERVLEVVFGAVDAERGAVLLRSGDDGAGLEVKAKRGYAGADEVSISRTIIEEVMERQKAVLTMDAQSDERFDHAVSIMMQGIRSVMCAPLFNDQQVVGLLYLDDRMTDEAFTANDLRLVGLIANMAAVKIENLRLLDEQIEKKRMEEQLALGAKIQRGLLPSEDPVLPGYDICGINQSCYEVGGDYYDFIPKEDGKLAVVVADISGKGVGAAMLMAVLQASLKALIHTSLEPPDLVARLNRVLCESSPANKFATLFYAELDPDNHRLEYVNGGHNPAYLAIDGRIEALSSTGPIVGIVPGVDFTSGRVELPAGAVFLLYTDGVTELEDGAGEEFGEERLMALLGDHTGGDAASLIARIRSRLDAWSDGSGADDDTTIVVVRRPAASRR